MRSGLDCPRGPIGFEDALAGLSGGEPKSTNPPSNCEEVCFGGGARVVAVSVVLGRTGGEGKSSPPMRSKGSARRVGWGGCLIVEEADWLR